VRLLASSTSPTTMRGRAGSTDGVQQRRAPRHGGSHAVHRRRGPCRPCRADQGREGGEEGGASGASPASGQVQRAGAPGTRAHPCASPCSTLGLGVVPPPGPGRPPPPPRPSSSRSPRRVAPSPPRGTYKGWPRGTTGARTRAARPPLPLLPHGRGGELRLRGRGRSAGGPPPGGRGRRRARLKEAVPCSSASRRDPPVVRERETRWGGWADGSGDNVGKK
jgi:hypothetical protein